MEQVKGWTWKFVRDHALTIFVYLLCLFVAFTSVLVHAEPRNNYDEIWNHSEKGKLGWRVMYIDSMATFGYKFRDDTGAVASAWVGVGNFELADDAMTHVEQGQVRLYEILNVNQVKGIVGFRYKF